MIVQQSFLNKLKDFGLNSYEAKLWAALLSRGVSTAGELSDIANVPRSRSYDVLESLERKGFVIMKLGKPIRYIAVPPSEVLERVKKGIQNEAEQQTKILKELEGSKILEELNLLHSQGIDLVDPADLTGVVKGRNNLYNHIDAMIKSAEKTVSIMTTEEGLLRKINSFKSTIQKAKEKGVKIKILAPINKKAKTAAKKLGSAIHVKHLEDIKARFCVVDGKEVTFMLMNDQETHPSYDVAVWANTRFFAKAIEGMFNSLFDSAK